MPRQLGGLRPLKLRGFWASEPQVHATDTGIHDDSVLAPDFRFAFPIIKLSREEYLKTVRGFTFKQGVPNLDSHPYDFR